MTERYSNGAAPTQNSRVGPLAPHLDGLAARLTLEGYAQETVQSKLELLNQLNGWLKRRKLQASDLGEQRIHLFLTSHRQSGPRRGDAATCRQLLEFLRKLGCTPSLPEQIDTTALERILSDFARFLRAERGLKSVTIAGYLRTVRCFLHQRFGQDECRAEVLCLKDINRFILDRAPHVRRRYRLVRPSPYLYRDTEITLLIRAARALPSRMGLRPHTYSTRFDSRIGAASWTIAAADSRRTV